MATKKTSKKVVKSVKKPTKTAKKPVSKKKETAETKKNIYSTNISTVIVLAIEALILFIGYLIIMNMA